MASVFPFTAIVGQEKMKRALILNAISPQIGGVLIRGERGTAKSTAARALSALLPEIQLVTDCSFSCDPAHPETFCDECRARTAGGEELTVATRRTRFVDLPVSATEDRVVGTLDIERAIQKGERHFEPGVLAAANRGLLYVDEVNLLDDHVVDLLLDSAAMGVNVVEREGISFSHPARFILVGTMNPEEGELRPQLLDRFALCVEIAGISTPISRVHIMERYVGFESDPEGFYDEWLAYEQKLSDEIARARELLPSVTYHEEDLFTIANLTASFQVDGHRADLVILKAALAHAAFEGRQEITQYDILQAAELALPHRLKRQPFQETEVEQVELEARLAQIAEQTQAEANDQPTSSAPSTKEKKNALNPENPSQSSGGGVMKGHEAFALGQEQLAEANLAVPIGKAFKTRRIETPIDRLMRNSAGKRSYTRTSRKRGRYVQSRPANGRVTDLALDATIRQAAPHQLQRQSGGNGFAVQHEDMCEKVRVRRASNAILFVVDASWSMAAAERMQATKGAILSLLRDAYQRRDRVGLVVFQKEDARLALPLTNSVEMAQKELKYIPVGGKTPLSHALLLGHQVLRREMRRNREAMPMMILLTDGAGNVSLTERPAQDEAMELSRHIRRSCIRSVVINMEHEAYDRGLAQKLAKDLGAPCYRLKELKAQELYNTVRDELEQAKPTR